MLWGDGQRTWASFWLCHYIKNNLQQEEVWKGKGSEAHMLSVARACKPPSKSPAWVQDFDGTGSSDIADGRPNVLQGEGSINKSSY